MFDVLFIKTLACSAILFGVFVFVIIKAHSFPQNMCSRILFKKSGIKYDKFGVSDDTNRISREIYNHKKPTDAVQNAF